jgi:hypothetical protein
VDVRRREQSGSQGHLGRISLRSAKVRRLRAEVIRVQQAAAGAVEELAEDGQDPDQ